MALPVIIILLIVYFYTLLILLFYLEIEKEPDLKDEVPEHPRPVSIVVPFRNEAEHLPGLIEDLAVQFYPDHMWELIFVDFCFEQINIFDYIGNTIIIEHLNNFPFMFLFSNSIFVIWIIYYYRDFCHYLFIS